MFRFVPMLWGFFLTILPSVVGRVMLALGVSYVTFTGFTVLTNSILDNIKTSMSGMPTEVVGFLAFLWVDKAIAMTFSAFAASMAIKAVSGDRITKMVTKTPSA